ncbi:MAG: hypothetical protein U1E73_08085 [Planctomycetota bacterium]
MAGVAGLLTVLLLAVACYGRHRLLTPGIGAGADRDDLFWVLVGTMVACCAACAVFFAWRAATRVAGPEYRLVLAMQRIRRGDLSFRVHLRRGDLLVPLARECNELLEWLNRNPPQGAVTGGDLVAVHGQDIIDLQVAGEAEDDQP